MHIHRILFLHAKNVHGFFPGLAIVSFLITCVILFQMFLLSSVIAEIFISSEVKNLQYLYLLAVTIIIRSILLWIKERFAQRNAVKIKSSIRKKVFGQVLSMGPSFTKTQKTGELIATVTDGVEKLDDYYTRYLPSIVHIIILPITIIIFTLILDWISGIILLVTGPLILFFMMLIGTYAKKLTQSQWKELSGLSSHFLDALQGLKTLKIFGMNKRETKRVDESSNGFRVVTMNVLKIAFLSGMVLELAASISIALVAVQIGVRLIEGVITYQPALFVLLLAPEFYLPFRTLGLHHHAGMEGAAAGTKIFEIQNTNPFMQKNDSLIKPGNNTLPSIEVKNIHFTYPESDQPVLKGINCCLEQGKITAIVGPTGTGKTTFANILLGFLQPTTGQILANGISIEETGQENWQKLIAYVPQHPHFFNATVLENLLLAQPNATEDQIIDAAMKAGANSFIQALPNQYNTPLTENASRLSGGEKQRLALARAFLKDAPILILDEPTSNLDPESEQHISDATEQIIKGRTTLIIAHRLKTVRNANKILVFDSGTIAESGTHEELIQKKGIYANYLLTVGVLNPDTI